LRWRASGEQGELRIVTDSTGQRQGWREFDRAVAGFCRERGFDLTAACQVGWYNARVEERLRLPDFGRPDRLALVIGNSRALWARLVGELRRDAELRRSPDPIEAYTERALSQLAAELPVAIELRWAHTVGRRMVAIQRLAHIAGLAYLSPANLCVHPVRGPWIALRAAMVCDVAGPPDPPPEMQSPCDACEHGCAPAAAELAARPWRKLQWRRWLAVRDSCPLGSEHRYSEAQLEYHYTKNRAALERAITESTEENL